MQVVELDLGTVVPSMSGPKRPHDRVPVQNMKADFRQCLTYKVCAQSGTVLAIACVSHTVLLKVLTAVGLLCLALVGH